MLVAIGGIWVEIVNAAEAMQTILNALPDEQARKDVLEVLLAKRCKRCFDYDERGQFWCCYDSRGR